MKLVCQCTFMPDFNDPTKAQHLEKKYVWVPDDTYTMDSKEDMDAFFSLNRTVVEEGK